MNKSIISIFIVVIIAFSAYYIFVLRSEPAVINPIDQNNGHMDYKLLESTNTESENANIDFYRVIGQIEEINNEELKIRTFERVLTIKKPKVTEYIAFSAVPIDETQLQQNDYVRATVSVDKATNEVVKLSVTVLSVYNKDETFEHLIKR